MARANHTDMGGKGYAFLTTHWSLIDGIKSTDDKDKTLIDHLLKRYWKPVYCYLRRKGHKNENAKDLTQGFFHDVVLNRSLARRADQGKGRFRAFLLHALDQYLINEWDKQNAQKRRPKGQLVHLELHELPDLPATISELTPEDSYNYTWLSELLERVVAEVEEECRQDGLDVHWQLFNERIVKPTIDDSTPPSLAQLCRTYKIESEKKAANMTITVKRRFQTLLKRQVRNTVATDEDVEGELQEIMQYLS
jgi:DNA-directed RNA polymerase specialized sigma24 family protein